MAPISRRQFLVSASVATMVGRIGLAQSQPGDPVGSGKVVPAGGDLPTIQFGSTGRVVPRLVLRLRAQPHPRGFRVFVVAAP